jgi:hypothetical protein
VPGLNPVHGLALSARGSLPHMAGRKAAGPRPGGPVQPRSGPCDARAPGVLRRGLGLEHHNEATIVPGKESGGWAHRGGGATTGRRGGSCDDAWQGPHRREGQQRLRLAPRAAGEDERGEGGSK